MRPSLRSALVGAALVCLLVAPPASARYDVWTEPDAVPIEPRPAVAVEPEPEPFALANPAPFGQLTDDFGPRWGRMHDGIDIGVLSLLDVLAAADGDVLSAGYVPGYDGYGQIVLLGHRDGYRTLYAHLSTVGVAVGQRVSQGDWIGNAGCTGSCTGTHLHFELHEHGTPVDPQPFLANAR